MTSDDHGDQNENKKLLNVAMKLALFKVAPHGRSGRAY
jgi:hypothetical protein